MVKFGAGTEAGPARRQPQHADRPQPRRAHAGGVRLRAPGRLRPEFQHRARHPREHRRQGRARVHHEAAQGPPLVRRPAVHHRRLPLLLGRRRQQQGTQPDGPAERPAGERRGAQGRDPRQADGALQLVEAESGFPAAHGGRLAAVHLPAGALPEAVPQQVQQEGDRVRRGRRDEARLGGGAQPRRQHVPVRQSEAADAAALDQHHQAAGGPLRRGAQSLFPPGRRERAPAALHRPRRAGGGGRQADPGQDRRRRIRPAGARHPVQQLHLPEEGREDQQLPDAAVEDGARLALRAVPEPERQRPGLAAGAARRRACAARCRWRSTARR